MIELSDHNDFELADEARRREVAYQAALAEIERRRVERRDPAWDEKTMMAMIVRKRADSTWHPKPGEECPTDLPPPLFRIGYEWAALTLTALLESVLSHPSAEIYQVSNFESAGRGLYRMVGKPRTEDKRRRAALDLIEMVERFFDHSRLLSVRPRRRSSYQPSDDDQVKVGPPTKEPPSSLLGASK